MTCKILRAAQSAIILAAFMPFTGQAQDSAATRDLFVTTGKSLVVDSPVNIQRVAVANPGLAEALAVTPREVLVNGLAPGETSLIIWQQGGNRLMFDLNVRSSTSALEAVRRELAKELPGQEITLSFENNTVFLRGTVKDLVSADRAMSITSTLAKTVNLLQVEVPPTDSQVLLKVRFANVDRAASLELGANFVSTGAGGTVGSVGTGQFSMPGTSTISANEQNFTLTDALNVFLFRSDLNLAATIKALQNRRLLETLAEPTVPAIDGKAASFLAGGEFPFPMLQGGAAVGTVTIQFREFGIRLNFVPHLTPRGTIRLQVTPEVSSLDFANGLVFQGFNIPALTTRRVQTEIELESGQSFGIAGLLDNRVVEVWSKIPGLGDIPFIGKLFQSKSHAKNNTELLVMVTPEIVRPIPAGQRPPELQMPVPFMEGVSARAPQTPGMNVTGPVPVNPPKSSLPVEELRRSLQPEATTAAPAFAPNQPGPPAEQPVPAAPPAASPAKVAAGSAG